MKRFLPILVLLCLALVACTGSAASSSSVPNNRPAPSETVRQFFAALDAKDYAKAYSLQNKAFQDEIPQDVFRQQLEQGTAQAGVTKQTSEILSEKVQGDKATVSYRLLSTMTDGSQQEGRGIYTLFWENSAWKMNLLPEETTSTTTGSIALPPPPADTP